MLHVHRDVARPDAQCVRDDLGEDGAVALPLRRRRDVHHDRAGRIDGDRRARRRAVLRPGPRALRGGQHGGDVAHVGDARLDHRREPDAVTASGASRGVAPCAKPREASAAGGGVERRAIVAGVEQGAGRGAVRERLLRDQVAADDVEGVEPEGLRDAVDEPFEGEVHLRPAEAPVEPGGGLVGEDDAVADGEVRDPVRPGHVAVGTVERGGLRRAQVGAAVVELIPAQRGDRAVSGDCRGKRRDPVGGRGRGQEVLQPVLDPLDRAARLARGEAHRDDIREDGLLDPEAPARIPRGAQPQFRAGDAQRPRHHRMQGEGTLEVGQDLVALLAEVFGEDHEALDRGAGVAWIAHRNFHPVRGVRERGVGTAVAETPVAHHVGLGLGVQERRPGRGGGERIDHRVERAVLDLDPIEGVLGRVTVAGHDHRYRLARIAHPIDGERVVAHGLLQPHADDERRGPRGGVLAGQDRDHLGHGEGGARVEGDDSGVGVRRAQDGGVGGAGGLAHVVGEAPAPGEQRRVLDALHRAPDEGRGDPFDVGWGRHAEESAAVPANVPIRDVTMRYRAISDGRSA